MGAVDDPGLTISPLVANVLISQMRTLRLNKVK